MDSFIHSMKLFVFAVFRSQCVSMRPLLLLLRASNNSQCATSNVMFWFLGSRNYKFMFAAPQLLLHLITDYIRVSAEIISVVWSELFAVLVASREQIGTPRHYWKQIICIDAIRCKYNNNNQSYPNDFKHVRTDIFLTSYKSTQVISFTRKIEVSIRILCKKK